MKQKTYFAIIATAFAVLFLAGFTKPAVCCMDFNNRPFSPGTIYNRYNDSIYADCGFIVKTGNFVLNGNAYFGAIRGKLAPSFFGSGNVVNTNNATLHFIRPGILHRQTITFDYAYTDVSANLSVNRGFYSGELIAAPASLGGVSISVTSAPLPGPVKGKKGTVTLSGNITQFSIGGREFWVDNVCSQKPVI